MQGHGIIWRWHVNILHIAWQKMNSAYQDLMKGTPSTQTASSGVVVSFGVLANENQTMAPGRNSTWVKAPATCPIATANVSTEMNDSMTFNPDGRVMLNCMKKRAHHKNKKLLNSKNITKISKMNLRTLKVKITRVDNKYEESRNRHTWISGSQNNTGGQQHSTNRLRHNNYLICPEKQCKRCSERCRTSCKQVWWKHLGRNYQIHTISQ